jgi:thiol-disulfide isomerase/thioredoxin
LWASVLSGCAIRVGDCAPDWSQHDLAGHVHSTVDYRGKVVLLDFWATWCAPCMIVSPQLQKLHDKYADRGLVILAVHYDDQGEPKRYMRDNGYTFTVIDDGLDIAKRYGVSKIPTIIVVDPEGRVAHRQTGFAVGDEEKLTKLIEQSLDKQVTLQTTLSVPDPG